MFGTELFEMEFLLIMREAVRTHTENCMSAFMYGTNAEEEIWEWKIHFAKIVSKVQALWKGNTLFKVCA